jgi:hypothetical protein
MVLGRAAAGSSLRGTAERSVGSGRAAIEGPNQLSSNSQAFLYSEAGCAPGLAGCVCAVRDRISAWSVTEVWSGRIVGRGATRIGEPSSHLAAAVPLCRIQEAAGDGRSPDCTRWRTVRCVSSTRSEEQANNPGGRSTRSARVACLRDAWLVGCCADPELGVATALRAAHGLGL